MKRAWSALLAAVCRMKRGAVSGRDEEPRQGTARFAEFAEEFAEERSPALKGWADVGCRCATAIVKTAQRSWARIGEPCAGLITLGLERGCLDGCKGLSPGSLSAFLLLRSDYRS